MPKASKPDRAEGLEGAPMQYAPENELGVVFLFAHLAKRWRLRIEEIRSRYPDCIAYQKIQGKERRVRIEFEFKSRSFKNHHHPASQCDWIVCWENNWPDAPKHLNIIELRREFGLGFNVWVMPVREPYKDELSRTRKETWSVPSQAHKGDLILFYFTHPDRSFSYLYKLTERAAKVVAEWKPGQDYMANIERVCELNAPLFLEDLQHDRVLRTAGFVRSRIQGRPNATEYWPYLHEMIVRRNPSLKRTLAVYAPESLA